MHAVLETAEVFLTVRILRWLMALLFCVAHPLLSVAQQEQSFRVLALAEHGGIHAPFVAAAKTWLAAEGARDHFSVDYIETMAPITDAFLSRYQLVIQLNYPPYGWTPAAVNAFERYIDEGRGGWIGFHHATLLGEFDGYPMWPWFSQFMGGIRWKDYIRTFATASVQVEDAHHPVMQGLPPNFSIENEEWYTYDRSPRAQVHVLASVNEATYAPHSDITMGDHPVVWTNDHVKARNVYIFMGHHPELFADADYTRLVHNSIFWAAGR